MLALVDVCQFKVSMVSVIVSVWPPTSVQSARKLCPDIRVRARAGLPTGGQSTTSFRSVGAQSANPI